MRIRDEFNWATHVSALVEGVVVDVAKLLAGFHGLVDGISELLPTKKAYGGQTVDRISSYGCTKAGSVCVSPYPRFDAMSSPLNGTFVLQQYNREIPLT